MSEPYIGEIRMFAGNFAPANWAFCDGQIIAINQNQALFALIGTTYGGDGVQTFGLPDLRGRAPVHESGATGFTIGARAGTETVAVTAQQLPAHTHTPRGATVGNAAGPVGNYWSTDSGGNVAAYHTVPPAPNGQMNGAALSSVGGNQAHQNMQPFLAISYIISLFGIFPSRP
jgi:microcystin-dependent protein